MVGPVTVEVIRGGLTYITEEMGIALRNSAYSTNIKERMDFSCAIFDPEIRLITQAEHIPVHLGSLPYGVKRSLETYKGELNPMDMIVVNDPYIGGTHLPDIILIVPIYFNDKLLGYVANKAHHSDVGGKVPGSMPGDATELFQEGIIIPPTKLVEKGKINEEIMDMILNNVRESPVRAGDLRAQIAANMLGIRRVKELCSKYGVENFLEAADKIMKYSERRLRNEIQKIPNGIYEAEDWLDDTGIEEEPVKIKVKIEVKGDNISFDYTGTSPQVGGPLNAVPGVTLAGVYYVLLCVTDPTIPMNDGCFRPISVYIPERTLLNPMKPAPVCGGNVETSQRNVDTLLKAFAQIVPKKVCAGCTGSMNNVAFGGVDERGGTWSFYETVGGGYGGRYGSDGVSAVHTHMTNTMNTPIEAIEKTFPLLITKYEIRSRSFGSGKWRGGCGIERNVKFLAPATLSILADRHKIAPWGLFGGNSAKPGGAFLVKVDGKVIKLRSKQTIRVEKGDVFIIKTAGGGGYGAPLEREPGLVLADLKEGYITLDQAYKEYGVVIKDGKIDLQETEKRRYKLREDNAT